MDGWFPVRLRAGLVHAADHAPGARSGAEQPDDDRRDHDPGAPAVLHDQQPRQPDQHERRRDDAEAQLTDQRQTAHELL